MKAALESRCWLAYRNCNPFRATSLRSIPVDRDEERSFVPGSCNRSPSRKFLSRGTTTFSKVDGAFARLPPRLPTAARPEQFPAKSPPGPSPPRHSESHSPLHRRVKAGYGSLAVSADNDAVHVRADSSSGFQTGCCSSPRFKTNWNRGREREGSSFRRSDSA